jgi:hypothetical protein
MPFTHPSENRLRIDAENPTFIERWVVGTYLVAGVFPTEGCGLSVERLVAQIPSFYAATRSQKRAMWPRGICGYYLIPIYIAESFDADVIEWVHSYHPYSWAIWHVPVLYNRATNGVEKRAYLDPRADKYHSYGSAFRPYLESIIGTGLRAISHRFGYELPETVNGKSVQKATA